MSYSAELKNQLMILEVKGNGCAEAELAAALLLNGSGLFLSEDKSYIKRVCVLANKSAAVRSAFINRVFYRQTKSAECLWGVAAAFRPDPEIFSMLQNVSCAAAFLRGCFLRSGYITPPDKTARIDLAFKDTEALELCKTALDTCGIRFHKTSRNAMDVLYLKNVEAVSDFLARIGAVKAMLEFENIRILKTYKNEVNRITNCDNANLDKTVSAAIRQVALITELMKSAAFETLPEPLKEIAHLRVDHPSLTLQELGTLLKPALSKSGVAHRLKKIEDIANGNQGGAF